MPSVLLGAVFLVLLAGGTLALAQPPGDTTISSKRALELERLVRHDCGSCHGMTLKGGLGPDIRSGALKGNDAETVTQIILEGVPGTPMPPWRPLITESEARWIATYLLKGGTE